MYVYFAEADTDSNAGHMVYVKGLQTSSVMDSEAVEIFWNYIDNYLSSSRSADDVFLTVFDKTANTIMNVSTTCKDTTSEDETKAVVVLVVIVLFFIITTVIIIFITGMFMVCC